MRLQCDRETAELVLLVAAYAVALVFCTAVGWWWVFGAVVSLWMLWCAWEIVER